MVKWFQINFVLIDQLKELKELFWVTLVPEVKLHSLTPLTVSSD